MANIKIRLTIEGANNAKHSLELAQEIVAMIHHRFRDTPHTIDGTANLLCPDCGKPMEVQDREIVCPACIAAWEQEFDLDWVIKQVARQKKHGPQQPLEALL